MATLTLTQGTGITLRKSGVQLIVDSTGGSGSSNCFIHNIENNSHIGLIIEKETYETIFSEAEIPNALIVIKVTSASSYGNSEAIYVYDGSYSPVNNSYKELGFCDVYINNLNNKPVIYSSELKLKRTLIESTGDFEYTNYGISANSASGDNSSPFTMFNLNTGWPNNPSDYNLLKKTEEYRLTKGGGAYTRYYVLSDDSSQSDTSSSSSSITIQRKVYNCINFSGYTITATKTGDENWIWTETTPST